MICVYQWEEIKGRINMIYLIQFLKMLSKDERKVFVPLFTDFNETVKECQYEGSESELVNEMLKNHLGYTFEDKNQLDMITKVILDGQKFYSVTSLF